jgi:hypothetical protein
VAVFHGGTGGRVNHGIGCPEGFGRESSRIGVSAVWRGRGGKEGCSGQVGLVCGGNESPSGTPRTGEVLVRRQGRREDGRSGSDGGWRWSGRGRAVGWEFGGTGAATAGSAAGLGCIGGGRVRRRNHPRRCRRGSVERHPRKCRGVNSDGWSRRRWWREGWKTRGYRKDQWRD